MRWIMIVMDRLLGCGDSRCGETDDKEDESIGKEKAGVREEKG